ncbi:MAG: 50S ribosomal protein L18 [Gemmatimonadales bacterium]|nr:MAG: 50S ribosomal protein L18 [Gemmatimonadales bacterium]
MSSLKFSKIKKNRRLQRTRRHFRVRRKVRGTSERPRLVVYRSLRNFEGQLVDDLAGETLFGVSTLSPELREQEADGEENRKVAQARAAGKLLGEKAREKGIEAVVFDRGGYKYHGRVKAFADGAREGGLKF